MYCLVAPFSGSFDEVGLIYFVPDFLSSALKKGQIAEIPFKESISYAIILDTNVSVANIDESKIKSIISLAGNQEVFLYNYQVDLIRYMARYYFTPIHNVASQFIPKNLQDKLQKNTFKGFDINNDYNYGFRSDAILSEKQKLVYSNIKNGNDIKYLLHGITGSGKTQIYIQLIKDCLNREQQVLLLIPEIILGNQISNTIKEVFGEDVLIINSTVSAAVRTKYFVDIHESKAKIIIATRSGLFYPYKNLGLIIVDEEHDNSYISDQAPRYHSLDLVNYISDSQNIPIVLGSGTPSVTSMYKAVKGEYKLLTLLEKYKRPE